MLRAFRINLYGYLMLFLVFFSSFLGIRCRPRLRRFLFYFWHPKGSSEHILWFSMLSNYANYIISMVRWYDSVQSAGRTPRPALNHLQLCVRWTLLKLFLFTACYQMFSQYRLGMIGRAHPAIFMEQHNVTHCEYFMNLHFNPAPASFVCSTDLQAYGTEIEWKNI